MARVPGVRRSKRTTRLLCAAIVAFTACTCAQARAVIFSDLDPAPNLYSPAIGQTVSSNTSQAAAFTPSANYNVGQIDIALSHDTGGSFATVSLESDIAGHPGTVLGSWNISTLPTMGTCCTLQMINPTTPLQVSAGDQYWLVVSGGTGTWDVWNFTNDTTSGTLAQGSGGDWTVSEGRLGAFEILDGDPSPTPEPGGGSFLLIGAGMLGMMGLARHRYHRAK